MFKSKILIVENEAIVAMDIKQKIKELGHQVVDMVFTGEDAIEVALEEEPELILMDIDLKGDMDGVAAVHKIKNLMDVPIIYMTAYSDGEAFQRVCFTEYYEYLIKPFDKNELGVNIEMALYNHGFKKKKSETFKQPILADFHDSGKNRLKSWFDDPEYLKNL